MEPSQRRMLFRAPAKFPIVCRPSIETASRRSNSSGCHGCRNVSPVVRAVLLARQHLLRRARQYRIPTCRRTSSLIHRLSKCSNSSHDSQRKCRNSRSSKQHHSNNSSSSNRGLSQGKLPVRIDQEHRGR